MSCKILLPVLLMLLVFTNCRKQKKETDKVDPKKIDLSKIEGIRVWHVPGSSSVTDTFGWTYINDSFIEYSGTGIHWWSDRLHLFILDSLKQFAGYTVGSTSGAGEYQELLYYYVSNRMEYTRRWADHGGNSFTTELHTP